MLANVSLHVTRNYGSGTRAMLVLTNPEYITQFNKLAAQQWTSKTISELSPEMTMITLERAI